MPPCAAAPLRRGRGFLPPPVPPPGGGVAPRICAQPGGGRVTSHGGPLYHTAQGSGRALRALALAWGGREKGRDDMVQIPDAAAKFLIDVLAADIEYKRIQAERLLSQRQSAAAVMRDIRLMMRAAQLLREGLRALDKFPDT